MSVKMPFLIHSIRSINPQQDQRWVPDGENMWFLPCVLDLKNQIYSGWWYGIKTFYEHEHYHTGITQGTVLNGEMILVCQDKKFVLKKDEGFLLPPHTLHSAELIPDKTGFLFFGTVVGQSCYKDSSENCDVKSYYDAVKKYYGENKIDLKHVVLISK